MKKLSNVTFLIFTLSVLSSCDKEIKLKLPPYESKVVINGELNTNSPIKLEISKSIPILDQVDSNGYLLKDATAMLYEENVLIGQLNYTSLFYTNNYKPLPGKKYRIEVSRPGMQTAAVTVDIPAVFLTNYVYVDTISFDNFGFPVGQLTIGFQDNGGINNYYQLSIRCYNPKFNSWLPLEIVTNDPIFINNTKLKDGSFIFSDATFNGQFKSINIPISFGKVSEVPSDDKFEISIKTFTDEYYRYMQQVRDFKQKTTGFDTDPIILSTNVVNGLGMVGGVYNAKDTIK